MDEVVSSYVQNKNSFYGGEAAWISHCSSINTKAVTCREDNCKTHLKAGLLNGSLFTLKWDPFEIHAITGHRNGSLQNGEAESLCTINGLFFY